jgi:hypothetical protein
MAEPREQANHDYHDITAARRMKVDHARNFAPRAQSGLIGQQSIQGRPEKHLDRSEFFRSDSDDLG